MKLHQFLQLSIIATLLLLAPLTAAEETEDDYDAGFVEDKVAEKLPEPQPQTHAEIPFEAKVNKKFSIAEPAFYIPVGIAAGVLFNIVAVIAVLVMKRRRANNISYSKMKMNAKNPVHSTTVELLE